MALARLADVAQPAGGDEAAAEAAQPLVVSQAPGDGAALSDGRDPAQRDAAVPGAEAVEAAIRQEPHVDAVPDAQVQRSPAAVGARRGRRGDRVEVGEAIDHAAVRTIGSPAVT